jgi:uncharacterized glyoxalase superfamily protein PhnB
VAEFRYVYYADAYDDSLAFFRDVLPAAQVDGWDGGRDNRGAIFAVGAGLIEVIAFHERLREHGANTVEAPRDLSWGHRDFGVREPGGMTLYFFSRV